MQEARVRDAASNPREAEKLQRAIGEYSLLLLTSQTAKGIEGIPCLLKIVVLCIIDWTQNSSTTLTCRARQHKSKFSSQTNITSHVSRAEKLITPLQQARAGS